MIIIPSCSLRQWKVTSTWSCFCNRTFSKYNKDGAYDIWTNVEMPKNGVCPVTGNVLEKVHLIQYDKLQSEFLEKVLVKGNVWSNADPTDLKGLLQFVKQRAPFDVVIDGLNVSYHEMATDK